MPECLETQLGSSPVSSLEVVSNFVVGSHSNPVRHLSVLLLLLTELLLQTERFDGTHIDFIAQLVGL